MRPWEYETMGSRAAMGRAGKAQTRQLFKSMDQTLRKLSGKTLFKEIGRVTIGPAAFSPK
jgi:hypothetical protein